MDKLILTLREEEGEEGGEGEKLFINMWWVVVGMNKYSAFFHGIHTHL